MKLTLLYLGICAWCAFLAWVMVGFESEWLRIYTGMLASFSLILSLENRLRSK